MDLKERIDAYFDDPDVREALIAAICRLVRVKSVKGEPAPGAPFGPGPRAALDEALALCAELGFKTRNYDNYVGLADLNDKETQLHILGHLDVVGEGEGWDTDPFTCVEKEGMLYGRGVSDDKGPVCAALFAMKAVRDLSLPLSKNVRVVLGTDEESGSSDIAYYYAREPYAPQSFTPDARFPVINVEKGQYHPDFGASWSAADVQPRVSVLNGGFRQNVVPPTAQAEVLGLKAADVAGACGNAEGGGVVVTVTDIVGGVRIHCAGRNAHAARPEEGINAISALLDVLSALPLADCPSTKAVRDMHELFPFGDIWGKALGIAQSDPESGDLTVNLALMTLTETGFSAKIDCRAPICANQANCADVCQAALAKKGLSITGEEKMFPGHVVPSDSPLVKTLLECYETFTGTRGAKPIAIGGGTYVHDIPGGVAFGCEFPGFLTRMHSPNERAKVEYLLTAAKMFTMAIAKLCA